jgi:hypothetical protein
VSPLVKTYARDFALWTAGVLALALYLTFQFYEGRALSRQEFFFGFVFIASGPLGGWVLAGMDGEVVTALWSLLPLTTLTIGPLVYGGWNPSHRLGAFAVAGVCWLAAGILYGVAIWA